MKLALIFPGQGAQFVGMGKDFYDNYPEAKEVFEKADQILGRDFSHLIFNGPVEELTQTKNSQLAIFITSVAIYHVLENHFDIKPSVCAGLSLGEYSALYAAGRITFKDALLLIQKRAELMNAACEKSKGTMAAVMGLSSDRIKEIVADIQGAWVANYNTPAQTVVSGTVEGVEKAGAMLKENGAKRVIPLKVSGAFHSGLMEPAKEGLSPFVESTDLQESDVRIMMNVTGDFAETSAVKENLKLQVTHSVCWSQTIERMKLDGIDFFLEMGPGKTLTAMNKKMGIERAFVLSQVDDMKVLEDELSLNR